MEHWTDALLNLWFVPVIALGASAAAYVVRRVLRNRPATRTSAMQRLIARNPAIIFDGARWTVAAQRIRIGWVTSLAVAVAVLIVVDHPRVVTSSRS